MNLIQRFITWLLSRLPASAPADVPPPEPTVPPNVSPPPPVPAPVPPKYDFSTVDTSKQATRAICAEEGLTAQLTDVLCACVMVESGFQNYRPDGRPMNHVNYAIMPSGARVVSSTDWGIVQVNDRWHIGKGKDFPSVDYVMANPDQAIRWMARLFKADKMNLWVSYSSGAYKTYL